MSPGRGHISCKEAAKYCKCCRTDTAHERERTNHRLHFVLSIFLCPWVVVWLTCVLLRDWTCLNCGRKGASLPKVAAVVGLLSIVLLVASLFWRTICQILGQFSHQEAVGRPDVKPPSSVNTPVPKPGQQSVSKPGQQVSKTRDESLPAADSRVWTDSSGKYSVQAELVKVENGKVQLRKPDGSVISIPSSGLSEADRNYLKNALNLGAEEVAISGSVIAVSDERHGLCEIHFNGPADALKGRWSVALYRND